LLAVTTAASAQTLLRVKARPNNDSTYAEHVQTKARFVYQHRVLGTVDGAHAILFDATNPESLAEVRAIVSSRNGVKQASRICNSFVQGNALTIGPGGEVYFDSVLKGDYQILVCAQVGFSRVSKPVWVAGTLPITSAQFTPGTRQDLNLPQPLQIVLDPYAKELKSKPTRLPKLAVAR
jgi:hypothetical protein